MSQSIAPSGRKVQGLITASVCLAAARTLLGAGVLARPTVLAAALGLDSGTAERTAWLARMFAGRDLALGAGSLSGSRGCQVAACAGDVFDLVALVSALRARQLRPVMGTLAAGTAAGAAVIGGAAVFATRE